MVFINHLIDLLFPRRCPVCGDIVQPRGMLICPACVKKLSFVHQPVCKKCGKEVFGDHIEYCMDCTRHKRSFESGMALLNYNEAAKGSMAAIKYKNKREYLDFYGETLALRYGKWLGSLHADALIPVPVHPSRRRKRGFNQAEVLARHISEKCGIPVISDLLLRTRRTAPQKELNPQERLKNLEEAFAVASRYREPIASESTGLRPEPSASLIPRRVILVDDIYTTGSTIEACTRVLKRAGVKQVYFITICIGNAK